jgi:hypothetical protein
MTTSVNNALTLSAGGCFFVANTTYQLHVGKSTAKGKLQLNGLTGLISLFNQCFCGSPVIALMRHGKAIQLA